MYCLRLIVLFGVYTAASLIGELLAAQYELAKPVVNHAVPIARHPAPDFGIFRRQGNCPILTLVCPAGNCCSYSTPCCGNTCCDSNSVCAGTSSGGSPCCVAIGDLTNTCGSSTKDPCANYPGTVMCSNINVCCPPANICYYDSLNTPRCAPQGSVNPPKSSSVVPISSSTTIPVPPKSTTPPPVPIASTTPVVPVTPTTSTIPVVTTTPRVPIVPTTPSAPLIPTNPTVPVIPTSTHTSRTTSSSPIPVSPTPPPDFTIGSHDKNRAVIGGAVGGGAVFIILVGLLIWRYTRKRSDEKEEQGFTGHGWNTGGGGDDQHNKKGPLNPTLPDLPRESAAEQGSYSIANSLAGTIIDDPMIIQPADFISPEESKRRRAKQAEINKANSGLYQKKNLGLIKGQRKIRVLKLEPNANAAAGLICSMTCESLDSKAYEALSYRWGKPYDREYILIEGFRFSVTRKLALALRQLRQPNSSRSIWIDAICMDQSNKDELDWHLLRMRDVYQNASRTLVWLGKGTIASNTAIDFFNKRGRCKASVTALMEDYQSNQESWRCLQDLLERPWWSRLWIVQEIIVSREALVMCGDRSIEFRAIPKLLGIAIKHNLNIGSYSTFISQYRRNINLMQYFRGQWFGEQSPKIEWWIRVFGLKHGCENARDKIWALHALAGDHQSSLMNDMKPEDLASDIFTKLTTHVISWTSQPNVGKDIDFICLGRGARRNLNFNPKDKDPGLPSWVPDLTVAPWESYSTLTRKSWLSTLPRQFWRKEDDFHASRPIEIEGPPGSMAFTYIGTANVSFSDSGRILQLSGVVVDKVQQLGQEYDLKLTEENIKHGTLTPSQLQHHQTVLSETVSLVAQAKQHHGEHYPRGNCSYDQALDKTLVCDRNGNNERLASNDIGFQDLKAAAAAGGGDMMKSLRGRFERRSMDQHFQRLHRRFMVSRDGSIGLVPPETQVGDVVCILYGCSVPVVLRAWNVVSAVGDGKPKVEMQFVGECYVHGIMDGEVVRDVREGRAAQVDDIEIF